MARHHACHLALIITTVILFVVVIAFNFLSMGIDLGIFESTTGNRSDEFYIEITPAGWTFSIWGFIYAYQAIFFIYALSTLCRKSVGNKEGYLYYAPGYMPGAIYIFYILNLAANMTWLFVFDRAYIIPALVAIVLIPFFLFLSIGLSMRGVSRYGQDFVDNGRYRELQFVWGMVHNALGMYATWVCIASLLNLAIVLVYSVGLDQELCSTISLGILAGELVLWGLLDFVLIERHTRFLFTPYFVVIVALIGSIAKNWDPVKRNSIITVCLLGFAVGLLMVKIILVAWRQKKKPLFKHRYQDTLKHPI